MGWLRRLLTSEEEAEPDGPWPTCDECGVRPAVCFGADLVNPLHRCGACCWMHGGSEAVTAHMEAHGIAVP